MKRALWTVLLACAVAGPLQAKEPLVGVRAGAGTDITGGVAYGVGVNRLFARGSSGLEVGALVFKAHAEETTEEFHKYEETTDVLVVGVIANSLSHYGPDVSGAFFVAGIGAGAISVDWEEKSPTDTSLGTRLPGGGSKQEESGTAGGLILNLGVGYAHQARFDMRLEAPIFIIAGAPGEASAVIPTATLTVGYRF